MKNRARLLFLLALVLLLTTGVVVAGNSVEDNEQRARTDPAEPVANLLENPSFEGPYSSYIPPKGHPDCGDECTTAQMADGWTPWWVQSDPGAGIGNPEYKPAELWHVPDRVYEGARAQQYFTRWRIHEAGIYQTVPATPGKQYRLRIFGHAWSSKYDNPYESESTLEMRVGIDPRGGTNWASSNVVWGPMNQQYNEYGAFYACATAKSDEITVYTYSRPVWPVSHNDVYWDDAELIAYSGECQLGLEVTPNDIDLQLEYDKPVKSDTTIDIKLPDEPRMTWHADLQPGGTLTPTLSASSGSAGQDLTVTIDSNGLPIGEYAVDLAISSDPPVPGNPKVVPIKLEVVPEIIDKLHVLPPTIGYIVDIDDQPGQMNTLAKIKIPYKPGITWNAEILPGGTLLPTLSATSGSWGEHITVSVDATGLPIGQYSANLKITTDPTVPGNPVTVRVFLSVVEEIQYRYMPVFYKQ